MTWVNGERERGGVNDGEAAGSTDVDYMHAPTVERKRERERERERDPLVRDTRKQN